MNLWDYIDSNAFEVTNWTTWVVCVEGVNGQNSFWGTFSECLDFASKSGNEIVEFDIESYPEVLDTISHNYDHLYFYKTVRSYFISDEDYKLIVDKVEVLV